MLGVALALLLAGLVSPAASSAADPDDQAGRLLLLLDVSGSMKEKDASGQPKIVGAKHALDDLIPTLPRDAAVGLRVYGATVKGGKPTPQACRDTQLAVPLGTDNRAQLRAAVDAVQPKGETPIAYSLRQAAHDLGSTGPRSIVLVSDGEESCVKDVCPAARALSAAQIDLKIDVIGLGVDSTTRKQLACIAREGRGRYYDARDAADLGVSVTTASLRALRPFRFNGSTIRGSADPARPTDVGPGLFVDSLGPRPAQRSYRLTTLPGATYHVNVTMRPDAATYGAQDAIRLRLRAPDGTVCGEQSARRVSPGRVASLLVATANAAVSADPRDAGRPCGSPKALTVTVDRDVSGAVTSGRATPYELVVLEEPPLAGNQSLPAGAADVRPAPVPAAEPTRPVVGGSSFSLAATLTAGSWTDSIRPGEVLVYRVRTQWGQRAVVSLNALAGDTGTRLQAAGVNAVPVDLRSFAPDRRDVTPAPLSARYSGSPFALTAASPTATYRNREVSPTGDSALAGYSYFVVQAGESTNEFAVPLRLDVAVTGAASAGPQYAPGSGKVAAASTPSAQPSSQPSGQPSSQPSSQPGSPGAGAGGSTSGAAATDTGASSALPWLLGGVAAVAVLALLFRVGHVGMLIGRIRHR
ncbi:hypothetical protein GCM10023145_06780 [Angustibacter luteus]